jgi:hypothetical protein
MSSSPSIGRCRSPAHEMTFHVSLREGHTAMYPVWRWWRCRAVSVAYGCGRNDNGVGSHVAERDGRHGREARTGARFRLRVYPALFIPTDWFGPLPEWMVPWVAAACVLVFVGVIIWAVRQRGR